MKPEIILNPFQDINGNTYWDSVASGDVFIMAFRFVSPFCGWLRLYLVWLLLYLCGFSEGSAIKTNPIRFRLRDGRTSSWGEWRIMLRIVNTDDDFWFWATAANHVEFDYILLLILTSLERKCNSGTILKQ